MLSILQCEALFVPLHTTLAAAPDCDLHSFSSGHARVSTERKGALLFLHSSSLSFVFTGSGNRNSRLSPPFLGRIMLLGSDTF